MARPSVIVVGYLGDALGIGEAARGYAEALAAAGCDVAVHLVDVPGRATSPAPPASHEGSPLPEVDADATADVVVVAVHPPQLIGLRAEGRRLPAGRAVVGLWAWEVDPLPAYWPAEATRLDEVWVHSPFVAGLMAPHLTVPVVAQPPPLRLQTAAARPADDPPTVLTMADSYSSLVRKNAVGAVRAFDRAVPVGAGPRLLVHARNGVGDPDAFAELRAAAAHRDDIDIVDRFRTRDELLDLIAGATCLLSLHRAEGLGLALFEALALGVPVVCTEGSGAGPLLDGTAARLVRATPTTVGEGVLNYQAGASWLEPDLDHAAEHLACALADPGAERRRAVEGRAAVLDRFSAATVGAALRPRIDALVADAERTMRRPSRPAVSVVLHATEPWPKVATIARAARAAAADVEVVVGASDDEVVPASVRQPGLRVVVVASESPFDLRQAALEVADGDLIVITEDHCEPVAGAFDAYARAHRERQAPVLAGPVTNGSTTTAADWANYLMGFSAWAPPLDAPPPGWGPTIANVALARSALGARSTSPGVVERELIPALWSDAPAVVPDAAVAHFQSAPLWRHAVRHFHDTRTAGAHERESGAPPRSLGPAALAAEARRWLALTSVSVGPRPELHAEHRRVAWPLRVLALARATGLAVGSRVGAGRAAQRLD